MRTGMGGGSNNIMLLREAVARLKWVLNATTKNLILISRVGLRKGYTDSQLTKRRPCPCLGLQPC